ncbi:CopG family ribbon-helix-helix protein [Halorubrum sp. Atlit-26R]|uniref:CopG family ribbon-helix-helix protein n=1 Tax=Halorubrum sp. Atlit-26R TaxID=2282128 RepID=UPI000EF19FC5|nr:CopG family ribbon-helix-helix protein [Halorubrum sp. Atlit-26R]RLM72802.1 ribbon-helix-helix protein, CopG family [Halorubrum sp. Atlit-26R]
MTVVSVSMPEELLERIDSFADEHGYTGRSEVVREASRNLLGEFEDAKLEDRALMAVVTVLFNYETTNVEERMMRLRHEDEGIVASNFHSHVGSQYCMELFVLEGGLEEISAFVGKVRATKDTLTVDYSVTPVDEFGAGALGDAHAHGGHGSGEAGEGASDEDETEAGATAEDD